MAARIKSDTLQALQAWRDGKPVRSIELGHAHRQVESPGGSPLIDLTQHIQRDQERAHAYVFYILGDLADDSARVPFTYDEFSALCQTYVRGFREVHEPELTDEERIGAESLAWKALLVGWGRAIAGHKEEQYIEVTNPDPPTTKKRTAREAT